ncbi:hypothetical protein Awo_c31440 [Acetobacterium woodii DSM 1030]|uniref:Uncharacterized protein n=2 Tax=Acetobacterium woodii TaxID=33952 RepID=H6LJE4_ACEWD|nr:hypothetical protein Awo_c31440 [Acetobacterium woodii DSM 1030]
MPTIEIDIEHKDTLIYKKGGNVSMKITFIDKNLYNNYSQMTERQKSMEKSQPSNQAVSKKTDTLDISKAAYQTAVSDETMSATSGKDSLGITKGKQANSYVIHFSDSAMVSRAISRGYLTVNGVDIPLSDDLKKQLTEIDRQAQVDREAAFYQSTIAHNLAVSKQQGEAWANAYKDLAEAIEIAAKISAGGKVSSSDLKKLMDTSPQLYAMAMAAKMMAERQEKQTEPEMTSNEETSKSDAVAQDVSWSDSERKFYETQMSVTMDATPSVTSIEKKEVVL